jgi:hypothetical protein
MAWVGIVANILGLIWGYSIDSTTKIGKQKWVKNE